MKPIFENNNKERLPFEHYSAIFAAADPNEIAARTGLCYDPARRVFTVTLMNSVYTVSHPDFEIEKLSGEDSCLSSGWAPGQILLLRYLTEGSLVPASGEFVAYQDMPWGSVYYDNFRGRCLLRFAYAFNHKADRLDAVMQKLDARPYAKGDAGYEFDFMNGLSLRLSLWHSDEEFPPSAQLLFSDNFKHAFSAEDMAFVGDVLNKVLKDN